MPSQKIIFARITSINHKYNNKYSNNHYAPPLSLAVTSALLKSQDITSILVDSFFETNVFDLIISISKNNSVKTIIIDSELSEIDRVNDWIQKNHQDYQSIYFVGKNATHHPDKFIILPNTYIISGDYEIVLAKTLITNQTLKPITICNPPDLKDFPPADFQLFAKYPYHYLYPVQLKGPKNYGFIETTRGCNSNCKFCNINCARSFYKNYKEKNIEVIVQEIKNLKAIGKNVISIEDDNFIQNKVFVLNLLKRICQEKINLPFIAQCRLDSLDPEILEWLRQANCSLLCIGFESGSQRILDKQNKNISADKMLETVNNIHKYNIWVLGFFIVGFSDETAEDLDATLHIIRKIDLDFLSLHYLFKEDRYNKLYAGKEISNLTKKYYKKILLGFYLSWRYFYKIIKRIFLYGLSNLDGEIILAQKILSYFYK